MMVDMIYTPKYKKEERAKECKWRKRPCNVPLHRDKIYYSTGIDQRYVKTQTISYNANSGWPARFKKHVYVYT